MQDQHTSVAGSYSKNPQYRVMVTDPDEDDEEEVCTVIVGLMQKDRRKLRCQGKANLTIGFDIYDVGILYSHQANC